MEGSMVSCEDYTLLLDIQGTVWGAGNNQNGGLGLAAEEDQQNVFAKFPELPPITSVYAGHNCSYFIDGQGNTFSCGDSKGGRLGIELELHKKFYYATRKVQLKNVKKIAANSSYQTLYLDESGSVWFSGKKKDSTVEQSIPEKWENIPLMQDISRATDILFLDENNEVWISEFRGEGLLRNISKAHNLPPIASIHAGAQSVNMLLDVDGYIWIMGDGSSFYIHTNSQVPYKIPNLPPFAQLSFNYSHCLAVTENREVFSGGSSMYGEVGRLYDGVIKIMENLPPNNTVHAGYCTSLFLDNQETVFACGQNERRKLGREETPFNNIVKLGNLPPILQKNHTGPTKSARNV